MPTPDKKPTPPEPRRKRTQDEIHRERLAERIAKLEADRDAAVRAAVEEINENAENDRKERVARASVRVMARYSERIAVHQKMLNALNGGGS